MFRFFKNLSINRSGWFLLTFSAVALEATALYFQHGMGLNPCVMCIYERLALLAILVAGVIGLIAPRYLVVRLIALALGLYGAIKGLIYAIQHNQYQVNPQPWNQCPFSPQFPETLPLNKWFPNLFEATGLCSENVWSLWGLSMAQWLIVIFAVYTLVLVIVLLSQLKKTAKRNVFS